MDKLNNNQLTKLFNKGTNELNNGNPLKAIEFFKKILFIKENNEIVLNNLAYAYFIIGDYINSEKSILKSIDIKKKNPYFYYNLGNLYKRISRLDDAIKNYDMAISLNANNHDYYYNKGYVLLKQKKYHLAWKFFEKRVFTKKYENKLSNIIKNYLMLSVDFIKEKKIAIVAEQGLGDQILFSSMYKNLLDLKINLKFINDIRLVKIFERSFSNSESISNKDYSRINELISRGYKFLLSGSLGQYFRKNIDDFDGESFLIPNKDKIDKYRGILSKHKFKKFVGIAWKSSNLKSGNKSIRLNDLKPLFDNKNIGFVSLQYGNNSELKTFNNNNNAIIEIEEIDLFQQIDDVISLVHCLDAVVTTPNVNVHFAGSVGKKCIVASPFDNELFLYSKLNDGKCEWYKNQKTFIVNNDLNSVLKEITKLL
jgi:tetratricopeptide (TPR) repeat protein|tara:strand:+ start:3367 stop:4641 length:1275 start_codon:yes stop_codon:yes gene_type:complete